MLQPRLDGMNLIGQIYRPDLHKRSPALSIPGYFEVKPPQGKWRVEHQKNLELCNVKCFR